MIPPCSESIKDTVLVMKTTIIQSSIKQVTRKTLSNRSEVVYYMLSRIKAQHCGGYF